MSKSGKTELFKSFLEAFENTHPTPPKATMFHRAQVSCNQTKHDQEKVIAPSMTAPSHFFLIFVHSNLCKVILFKKKINVIQ